MENRIRVLAVDDSAMMREVLRMVFSMHATSPRALPAMELIAVVKDGIEALEAVRTMQPDLLLLDLEMPRLDGLGVLKALRDAASAMPVILCSAHTERGARATLEAMSAGAKDYVMKPGQAKDFATALDGLRRDLLPKIAALMAHPRQALQPEHFHPPVPEQAAEMVVIGVSTGGPAALEVILPALGAELPVPVLVVQHMPKLFTGALAERLNRLCAMPVEEATDGSTVQRGMILVAPGDAHMEVVRGVGQCLAVHLQRGPARNSCRPSVDTLFESAARVCGRSTLALVLTGMGSDGLAGARAVKQAGGAVLAQDEATSAVWGMPGCVVREGLAVCSLPLGEIAGAVLRRARPAAWGVRQLGHEVAYGLL